MAVPERQAVEQKGEGENARESVCGCVCVSLSVCLSVCVSWVPGVLMFSVGGWESKGKGKQAGAGLVYTPPSPAIPGPKYVQARALFLPTY